MHIKVRSTIETQKLWPINIPLYRFSHFAAISIFKL